MNMQHQVLKLIWSLSSEYAVFFKSRNLNYFVLKNNLTYESLEVTICTARFNKHKFCVLRTEWIYVFCVWFRTNKGYFPAPCLLIFITEMEGVHCSVRADSLKRVDIYTNLLMKPATAQLHLYNLRHVSAVTIRPSSGRMLFLNKAAYGTLLLINIYI
jgi:hypothetical protein